MCFELNPVLGTQNNVYHTVVSPAFGLACIYIYMLYVSCSDVEESSIQMCVSG